MLHAGILHVGIVVTVNRWPRNLDALVFVQNRIIGIADKTGLVDSSTAAPMALEPHVLCAATATDLE